MPVMWSSPGLSFRSNLILHIHQPSWSNYLPFKKKKSLFVFMLITSSFVANSKSQELVSLKLLSATVPSGFIFFRIIESTVI